MRGGARVHRGQSPRPLSPQARRWDPPPSAPFRPPSEIGKVSPFYEKLSGRFEERAQALDEGRGVVAVDHPMVERRR